MDHICRIDTTKSGEIKSSCGSNAEGSKIMKVRASPLYVTAQQQLPIASLRKKHKLENYMVNTMQRCYEGKLNEGMCQDPIQLIVFKYQHCPACDSHLPTIQNRLKVLQKHHIPVQLRVLDVKTDDALELYQRSGCRGTPCVVFQDPRNSLNLVRIAEGIDQNIGFYSNLGGFENPIFAGTKANLPKRLMSTEVKTKWL